MAPSTPHSKNSPPTSTSTSDPTPTTTASTFNPTHRRHPSSHSLSNPKRQISLPTTASAFSLSTKSKRKIIANGLGLVTNASEFGLLTATTRRSIITRRSISSPVDAGLPSVRRGKHTRFGSRSPSSTTVSLDGSEHSPSPTTTLVPASPTGMHPSLPTSFGRSSYSPPNRSFRYPPPASTSIFPDGSFPTYQPQFPNPPQFYDSNSSAYKYKMQELWSDQEIEAWKRETKEWGWKSKWDGVSGAGKGQDMGTKEIGWRDEEGRKIIDLVFVLDATGSMGSYLKSATENIRLIVQQIAQHEGLEREDDLRIAVVAYRDLPEQCASYTTKEQHFTSDIDKLHLFIAGLTASGGGDGPEATASAMQAAYERLQWRTHSAKCCILVTDAPPHGIGESGDSMREGEPAKYGVEDPLVMARMFAARGIPIFVIACEPNLSSYRNAVEFYQAICSITSGMMLPLKTADLLAKAVIGAVLEHTNMERLIREIGHQVALQIQAVGSIDVVIEELHRTLQLRGDETRQVRVENVYNETESYKHNVKVWSEAENLAQGRPMVLPWDGRHHRFSEAYRSSYGDQSKTRLPARPSSTSTPATVKIPVSPPSRRMTTRSLAAKKSPKLMIEEDDDDDDDEDEDDEAMSDDSDVAARGGGSSTARSPKTKTDGFAPFKATQGAFGSLSTSGKIGSPPGIEASTMASQPAFQGMRGGATGNKKKTSKKGLFGMDDDDDDNSDGDGEDVRNLPVAQSKDEDEADTFGFAMGSISREQAKRIATQSIWRMRG